MYGKQVKSYTYLRGMVTKKLYMDQSTYCISEQIAGPVIFHKCSSKTINVLKPAGDWTEDFYLDQIG
jgi:hypothetical protein